MINRKLSNKNLFSIFLFFILLNTSSGHAQFKADTLTLDMVLNQLLLESPKIKQEKIKYENVLLEYENYKKGFLPTLSFSLSPFSFNRSLRQMQRPDDGSYSYIEDYSGNSSLGVSVNQKVAPTGGDLSFSSNLNFLREFSNDKNTFNTTPFSIGYSQQLFGGYQQYKTEKRKKEIERDKQVKDYCSNISSAQSDALGKYMNLFSSYLQKDVAMENLLITDTLLQIAKIRLENGNITDYEYNQVELQYLNNEYVYGNACNSLEEALLSFYTFLGVRGQFNTDIVIDNPEFNLPIYVDYDQVLFYVNKNNTFKQEQEIQRLEEDNKLIEARRKNFFNGTVSLNYGSNSYAETLAGAYKNPSSWQSASLSLELPVFNWGINKNTLKIAENNYKMQMMDMETREIEFEDEIKNKVINYNNSVKMYDIAEKMFTLAKEQHSMSIQKFTLGKIAIYDFVTSQQGVSNAMQQYYNSLQNVWSNYYTLRETSLYDFILRKELTEILLDK